MNGYTKKVLPVTISLFVLGIFGFSENVFATTDCTFTISGSTMILDADCTTDETILIPDGFTLDGNSNTITAVDPPAGHFVGAVVQNDGTEAHVKNLIITSDSLTNVCDAGANRLRGIMFVSASGSIIHNAVVNINQGASGCQEGNAIEVRNAPFDGTHPDTQTVEISHNKLTDWQKTGIVANGDVDVNIHHNYVGASATQLNLAANSIQLGFGAIGSVTHNNIEGNEWKGTSFFAASGILVFAAEGEVSKNNISGNSDVGIFLVADNVTVYNNRVFDIGDDHPNSCCDIGVGNFGSDNVITNNKVRGFEEPYDGVSGGKNKQIPGPQPGNVFF